MLYKRLITAALVFGAAAVGPPAQAQTGIPCFQRPELVKILAETYHEEPIGMGLQGSKLLIELWRSPETGSFTIIASRADGVSCIVTSGLNWQERPRAPDGRRADGRLD